MKDANGSHCLTKRQQNVLSLAAKGLTGSEIAEQLGYSRKHVENVMREICAELGARNTAHAVAIGLTLTYIELDLTE